MAVVKSLKRCCVPLLGLFDRLSFVKLFALSLFWVGQDTFSGRTLWDAANYLSVVWLAGDSADPKVTCGFRISEVLSRSADSGC